MNANPVYFPPNNCVSHTSPHENIFYPKEASLYNFKAGLNPKKYRLIAENIEALFHTIIFSEENGLIGITVQSYFLKEMNEFLEKNKILKSSDCEFFENNLQERFDVQYYTTNSEVFLKLAKIVLRKNHINDGKIKGKVDALVSIVGEMVLSADDVFLDI